MKIRSFFLLLLTFCLLFSSLISCTSSSKNEEEIETKDPIVAKWEYINENISDYSIVLSADANDSDTKMVRAFAGTVMKVTTKSATLYSDDDQYIPTATEKGEIIIGITNRLNNRYQTNIDDTKLEVNTYEIEYFNNDVVVHYNGISGLSSAILTLLSYLAPTDNVDTIFLTQLERISYKMGALKLKNIYQDGMLLQQNRITTLIGESDPNINLSAKLLCNGTTVAEGSCKSAADGTWNLPMKMPEGSYNKHDLVFYVDGIPTYSLTNILVGELWIATGQSNMAYTMAKDTSYYDANFDDNNIRILNCTRPSTGYSITPLYENNTSVWYAGDNKGNMAACTAIGYYFAKELRKTLDIPVGLIYYAVGGTPIRSWLSFDTINSNKELYNHYSSAGTYVTGTKWEPLGSTSYRNCAALYNTMTSALKGLTIGGVAWYQGEQDLAELDTLYTTEMELLYKQYKMEFGWGENENMPFVFPNLMPYYATRNPLYQSEITLQMEAFALNHKGSVAMIEISDTTPEFNSDNNASHPHSKEIGGTRMGVAACAIIQNNDKIPTSSPYFVSARIDGNSIIAKFANVADGLCLIKDSAVTVGDTELHGFSICGSNGVYVMAKAKIISKDEVKIWHDSIQNPIAASYNYGFSSYYSNLGCMYEGKLLYKALTFYYNTPSNAKQIAYIPWASCDQEILWRVTRVSVHYGAYDYAWRAANADLVYSNAAAEGRCSLKLTHTSKTFTVSPNTNTTNSQNGTCIYNDCTTNFSPYTKITIQVKNAGTEPIVFNGVKFNSSTASLAANSDCKTNIPADNQWHTLTIDISSLGSALKSPKTISFEFAPSTSGELYFDDFQLLP